jgi:hypothetical protein
MTFTTTKHMQSQTSTWLELYSQTVFCSGYDTVRQVDREEKCGTQMERIIPTLFECEGY